MINKLIIFLVLIFQNVYCHSWVACTDYRYVNGSASEKYYDNSVCFGFPPGWEKYKGTDPIGSDLGYNYQGASGTCQPAYTAEKYNAPYGKATWVPNTRVCMAWPAKNHARGTCTNQFIPDSSLIIYITGNGQKATIDLGSAEKGTIGFQNCPAFCEGGVSDKVLCHRCITVPNLPSGTYKVSWEWVFNPGTPYITCFDVDIKSDGNTGTTQATTQTTQATTQTTTTTTQTVSSGSTTSSATQPLSTYDATITNSPITIPTSGAVVLDMIYSCGDPCVVVVDLLDPNNGYAWYGKAEVKFNQAGSGAFKGTLNIQNNPTKKSGYILKTWVVTQTDYTYTDPWTFELIRKESPVAVGDSLVYPTVQTQPTSTQANTQTGTQSNAITSSSDAQPTSTQANTQTGTQSNAITSSSDAISLVVTLLSLIFVVFI